jgi:hypothetical protein
VLRDYVGNELRRGRRGRKKLSSSGMTSLPGTNCTDSATSSQSEKTPARSGINNPVAVYVKASFPMSFDLISFVMIVHRFIVSRVHRLLEMWC